MRAAPSTVALLLALVAAACAPVDAGARAAVDSRDGAAALPARLASAAGLELALVPAGRFRMGSSRRDGLHRPDELPAHEVAIPSPLYFGTTEVTVGQFARFVAATGFVTEAERSEAGGFGFDLATGEPAPARELSWRSPGYAQTDEHPVVQVSWEDAEAFCAWLSQLDGRAYRLPTEAEWEYACRAGTTTRWWFGDDPEDLARFANVADSSLARVFPAVDWAAPWDDGEPFNAPVARRPANPWGLFDVTGNAWEWCADWHDPGAYARAARGEDPSPAPGKMRAIRGGGWYDPVERTRSAQRAWFFPVFRACMLSGFRVVCAAP